MKKTFSWVMSILLIFGLVYFGFVWFGVWVLTRCTTMQNFQFFKTLFGENVMLLAWKLTKLLKKSGGREGGNFLGKKSKFMFKIFLKNFWWTFCASSSKKAELDLGLF